VWLIAGACGAVLALAVVLPILLRSKDAATDTGTNASAGSPRTTPGVVPTPEGRPLGKGSSSGPKLGNGPDPNPASMPGPVNARTFSLAFTLDGLHAVSHSGGSLYFWDLQKRGQAGEALPVRGRGPGRAGAVAVAPDGTRLAAFEPSTLVLFDFDGRTFKPAGPLLTIGSGGIRNEYITGIAFSPDSALLAMAQFSGHTSILSVETRQPTIEFNFQVPVFGMAF
jgi:hypothetical protein